ncbi:hypothetical protein I862_05415 [endosymbiont of Acanthamoeba sp. UWC8]|uniref:hypothetical protein n=1 Tax=endosymbiont of Acanthamoeba sp. UWC8 TaxID=86106 RepID=UPI0004D16A42|nr:hypothetical protein [endosymbiont of Acanthamoeba sp. UWC8]AIF81637.1 hypothetical protein I862_05415 [endosymbiont of Acanthamoeba sp. UWC8]
MFSRYEEQMKSNLVNIIPLSSEGMENLSKLNTSASNFITNYYLTGLFQDVFSQLVGANPEHNYKTQAFILKLGEKKSHYG